MAEKTSVMTMGETSDLLSWADIFGLGDVTLKVKAVTVGEVTGDGGRKSKMAMVEFHGQRKRLGLNTTNKKSLVRVMGSKFVEDWTDRPVTLYVTDTSLKGAKVSCIRVRDSIAAPAQEAAA